MEKTCSRCKVSKPLEEGFARNKNRPDGRQVWCRTCNTVTRTEWARANKVRVKAHRIKHRYGLTLEDMALMLAAQNNRCAVCDEEFTQDPCIDHNHITGHVRALLCKRCNTFIGYVETHNVIDKALKYLTNEVVV